MQALIKKLTDKKSQAFADNFGNVFKTAPHLPKEWVDFLVKIAPTLAMIGAVLSFIAGPILGLLSILSLLSFNPFIVFGVLLSAGIAFLSAALLFKAVEPLKKREYNGWLLLFWCDMLGVAHTVFTIFFHPKDTVGAVVGTIVGLYILYEMRPRYK